MFSPTDCGVRAEYEKAAQEVGETVEALEPPQA